MYFTNYEKKFRQDKLFRSRTDKDNIPRFNYLDFNMTRILRNVKNYINHEYKDSERITAISYRYYGTTTLYWVILAYNGIINPFNIEPGTSLKIPNLSNLGDLFNEVKTKKRSVNI